LSYRPFLEKCPVASHGATLSLLSTVTWTFLIEYWAFLITGDQWSIFNAKFSMFNKKTRSLLTTGFLSLVHVHKCYNNSVRLFFSGMDINRPVAGIRLFPQ